MAKNKAATPTLDSIAKRLSTVVSSYGERPSRIVLGAVSINVLLLGSGSLCRPMIRQLSAEGTDVASVCRRLWEIQVRAFPYLDGHVRPLTEPLDHATAQTASAYRAAFRELAKFDLVDLVESPLVAGDVLGPLYMLLIAPGDARARGAFYTPAGLSRLIAATQDVENGTSVHDPACGSAGMLVAVIRHMRSTGRLPETVSWSANDIDPVAVALAGVNLSAHGMPLVELTCSNALVPATA